jgi:hypothetical protein
MGTRPTCRRRRCPALADAEVIGSWGLFFTCGSFFVAYGVYLAVLPSADPDHWRYDTTGPDMIAYLAMTSVQ